MLHIFDYLDFLWAYLSNFIFFLHFDFSKLLLFNLEQQLNAYYNLISTIFMSKYKLFQVLEEGIPIQQVLISKCLLSFR